MSQVYTISKATVEDVERINTLVNSAYRGETSRKGWTTEADLLDGTRVTPEIILEIINKSDTTILLYEEQGKIFGCIELRKDDPKLYLGMLTVDPESQGKGIGKILLQKSEAYASSLSCSSIYMSVISSRTELINWYKRHGYNETGERKPFNMPDERWGVPKMELQFIYLEKSLS